MKNYTISDVEGNVLYTGRAQSKKKFIEQLVKDRKSLARADLRGANLTHLTLDHARLEGADLSGANLTGTSCRHSVLAGCDLRGVTAAGLRADRSDFRMANLSRHPDTKEASNFAGAILSYSKFEDAVLDGADFGGAGMSRVTFVGASVMKAKFRKTSLHNADWAHATVYGCDFGEADMTPTMQVSERHLPDRTKDSTVVGNSLKGAQLGAGNGAFRTDQRIGTLGSYATWTAVTGAYVTGTSFLPMDADVDLIGQVLGKGMGLVAVSSATMLLKEKIGDSIKEKMTEGLNWANLRVRQFLKGLARRGTAISSLAVAYVSSGHADSLVEAIKLTGGRRGLARLGTIMGGKAEVIVCNRKRLAQALTRMSETIDSRGTPKNDIVLIRCGKASPDAPRAIVHGADGSVLSVWKDTSGTRTHLKWHADGTVTGDHDIKWRNAFTTRIGCFKAFADALLEEHGAADMAFDEKTHAIRTGRDGSVVFVRKSDGAIDNRRGPAILTPEGERLFFRSGSHVGHEDEAHPKRRKPVAADVAAEAAEEATALAFVP